MDVDPGDPHNLMHGYLAEMASLQPCFMPFSVLLTILFGMRFFPSWTFAGFVRPGLDNRFELLVPGSRRLPPWLLRPSLRA
jgi:hypothetical protein